MPIFVDILETKGYKVTYEEHGSLVLFQALHDDEVIHFQGSLESAIFKANEATNHAPVPEEPPDWEEAHFDSPLASWTPDRPADDISEPPPWLSEDTDANLAESVGASLEPVYKEAVMPKAVKFTCGGKTATGAACKREVSAEGEQCYQHQDQKLSSVVLDAIAESQALLVKYQRPEEHNSSRSERVIDPRSLFISKDGNACMVGKDSLRAKRKTSTLRLDRVDHFVLVEREVKPVPEGLTRVYPCSWRTRELEPQDVRNPESYTESGNWSLEPYAWPTGAS